MSLDHWYFDKELLRNSPSRKHGVTEEKEQAYLQKTANLIQEMARKLALPLICINTAVLFTQRFYVFHPITLFEKFSLAASAVFLAAKVEENSRKVEHVCQVARKLGIVKKEVKDVDYCQELLLNENVLLQTLGFEVLVQHPHQHVLRLCQLFQAGKPLSQTSYLLATYCLHLTRMCLVYKPVYIACLCIYMACKSTNWEIPLSREGRPWYTYGDAAITEEILESMCEEFLDVFKQCPESCKNKTLTSAHENLLKKLSLHTTGLPIVQEVDQNHGKMDSTPSTSNCDSANDVQMSEPNEAAEETSPVLCHSTSTANSAIEPMAIQKYDSLSIKARPNVSHTEKHIHKNTPQPMEIQKYDSLSKKVPQNVSHSEKHTHKNPTQPMAIQKYDSLSHKVRPTASHSGKHTHKTTSKPLETQQYDSLSNKVPQNVSHSEKHTHKNTSQPMEIQKYDPLSNQVPQNVSHSEKHTHKNASQPMEIQKHDSLSNKVRPNVSHSEEHTLKHTSRPMETQKYDSLSNKVRPNVSHTEKNIHKNTPQPMEIQKYDSLSNKVRPNVSHTEKYIHKKTPQPMEIQKYDPLSHKVRPTVSHPEKHTQKITPQPMETQKFDSLSNKVRPYVSHSEKHIQKNTSQPMETQKYDSLSHKVPQKETYFEKVNQQPMDIKKHDPLSHKVPQKEKYLEKVNQQPRDTQKYDSLPNKVPQREKSIGKMKPNQEMTPQTMEMVKYKLNKVSQKDKHYDKVKPYPKIPPSTTDIPKYTNKVSPHSEQPKHSNYLTPTSALASSTKTDKTNYSRLSQSTSLISKPLVPPLKIQRVKSYDELTQTPPNPSLKMKFKIPKTNLNFDTPTPKLSSSNSIKTTIPKSDYNPGIFHETAATMADVETDKMAYTLTPASMGNEIVRNAPKKFKPN